MRACRYPAFDGGSSGGAREGTSERTPLDSQRQARFAGVQPSTPASHPASFIDYDSGRTAGISHEPEELRPRTLLPASDAGTLRLILKVLRVRHGEYLPALTNLPPRTRPLGAALQRNADSAGTLKAHGYRP